MCRTEPATRQCDYCIWDEHEENIRVDPYKGYGLVPPADDVRYRPKEYCFACFALEHRKSREVRWHISGGAPVWLYRLGNATQRVQPRSGLARVAGAVPVTSFALTTWAGWLTD